MSKRKKQSSLDWYIEHRMEYLQRKLDRLRHVLDDETAFDYDALREFMETKGRLKELEHIKQRMTELEE